MATIDGVDKRIVDLLMADGRMSSADIARALGDVSERSVRYRMNRLITQGVIDICVVPHPHALGLEVVADVFIEVEAGMVMEVAHLIAAFENVSYVACSTGDRDISVQIYARNNVELFTFVTDVLGKIPGVRKTTTSIVPIIIKDVYRWQIPSSMVSRASDDRGFPG